MSASERQGLTELYEFGPFRVDPEKETLCRAGEPVPLTPKTFQVLMVLVRHSKEVVTKDDLLKTVWPDTFVGEANLSRNIFMLRKALGESAQDRQYIITVPGQGYRLAESVHLVPESELSIIAASHSKAEVQIEQTQPWGWISLAVILLLAGVAGTLQFSRTARQFSMRKTRLCLPLLRIPPVTRSLTAHCGRAWPCSLSSRRF
jgi:DNA-binding winged helix-turn-helix (wHTH) protein